MSFRRRYYTLKIRQAVRNKCSGLEAAWRAERETIPWPDLPSGFPARDKLLAENYQTVRDLDGAELDELLNIGLTTAEAEAVLTAMEQWQMIILVQNNYQRADGRWASVWSAPLLPAQTATSSVTSDTLEMGDLTLLRLSLVVSAASGSSPTLDVLIETSPDGSSDWKLIGSFGQKTTTTTGDRQRFPHCDRFVRARAVIGGTTPSFTFSLLGEAV